MHLLLAAATHAPELALPPFIAKYKSILITIFVGAVAGVIADMLITGKGLGLFVTILIGIAGGYLANWLFQDKLNLTHIDVVDAVIRSTAGAIILSVIINLLIGKRNTKGYK